jgi:formylglycine-generating enzyme required for sulfatase activity
MLRIPAGEFIRGSDSGLPNEAPQQTIFLDEFYIDQYEVTNRLYEQCVKAARCALPRMGRSVNFAEYYAKSELGSYPVISVAWEDAKAYCEFVGKRLPSEAEWEKAARGTDGRTYPWGEAEPTVELANFGYNNRDAKPVGSYPAGVSPYGVHDMAGNVREWVADWYQFDYYQNSPTQNPLGPSIETTTKVLRGGGWNENIRDLSTTRRKDYLPDPDTYDLSLGFRCASSTFPPSR